MRRTVLSILIGLLLIVATLAAYWQIEAGNVVSALIIVIAAAATLFLAVSSIRRGSRKSRS